MGEGLWSKVLKGKYIKCCSLTQWIQNPHKTFTNSSIIWTGLIRSYPKVLGQWLSWKIGRGIQVFVEINPLIAFEGHYKLSDLLLSKLHTLII